MTSLSCDGFSRSSVLVTGRDLLSMTIGYVRPNCFRTSSSRGLHRHAIRLDGEVGEGFVLKGMTHPQPPSLQGGGERTFGIRESLAIYPKLLSPSLQGEGLGGGFLCVIVGIHQVAPLLKDLPAKPCRKNESFDEFSNSRRTRYAMPGNN